MDTFVTKIRNVVSQIQTSLTNFVENKKKEQMLRMQAETTRPQWGDDQVFKQAEASKVSNVSFKKPEPMQKKGPILK